MHRATAGPTALWGTQPNFVCAVNAYVTHSTALQRTKLLTRRVSSLCVCVCVLPEATIPMRAGRMQLHVWHRKLLAGGQPDARRLCFGRQLVNSTRLIFDSARTASLRFVVCKTSAVMFNVTSNTGENSEKSQSEPI